MADETPTPRGPDAVTHQLPAGELPPGWKLLGGQYEIKRLIASGGFGITYLAQDTLERDVAVKECFPLGLAQRQAATHAVSATSAGTSEHFETARAQFLREARMLARLRHPNVVHVQTLFEENGTAYMAIDFIHGRDLQEEIVGADGAFSPHRVLELARDLLGALKYIHDQSVLHRDIKPQNIRIDRFGMPMLIDFGAARAETQARSRMAGTFRVVTDGYSPHEFYVSGAQQGPYSDLYALAATLHHVITGAAPIAADERASAIATGQPDPYQPIADAHPDHDGRLLHLIDRALRMTPGDRPKDAGAWLAALADAPTTMVTPMAAPVAEAPAPAPRSGRRFLGGALLGGVFAALVGAGIWSTQPAWLSPGMDEMMAEMGRLEAALAEAEAARGAAEAELSEMQAALNAAEENLARLETADGDMAATMAELEAARAARDAAAGQVAELERSLETLAVTQAALEDARAARDAATQRATDLAADNATATNRITELEALLAAAQAASNGLTQDAEATAAEIARLERELASERTRAAALANVDNDLTAAEAALAEAAEDIADLETRLAAALEAGEGSASMREEMDRLEGALEVSEAERARLLADLAEAEEAMGASDANASEIERLRGRIAELEAENANLAEALALTEAALADALGEGPMYLVETATLSAPNGTLSLLPRFSWDNATVGLVDSTGGIALFDRESGVYQAHLARGIPDEITRLGFSMEGGYAIATTGPGTPNRLYDIANRREILRFEPTTVTTANRAISRSETHFVYTRASVGGQTDIVLVDLANTTLGAPSEQILTSVPDGTSVRVTFAENADQITVITPSLVRVFETDGRLSRTAGNRIGPFVAMSPMGGDQGLLILRNDGGVTLYDNALDQRELADFPPSSPYTRYRLSGDRLSFMRASGTAWEIIDLVGRNIRGSGSLPEGTADAFISVSSDGQMLFVGAAGGNTAQLIDVATGGALHDFGEAAQGYFSFDNSHIAVGIPDQPQATIFRREGSPPEPLFDEPAIVTIAPQAPPPVVRIDTGNCAPLGPAEDGRGITPDLEGRSLLFPVEAGGEMNLSECWSHLPQELTNLVEAVDRPLFVTPAPAYSTTILSTSRALSLDVSARSGCDGQLVAQFGQTWRVADPLSVDGALRFGDAGEIDQPLRVWLATADANTTCDALIELRTSAPSGEGIGE
ncbi:protein kinase domain-containing protein [Gymnodinialimonas hymeniacidonis]|uniref:protein kinase domain-containing protein n=1 Tax=Gymnodinialimonas hymeniacidonis TaxID=3126508 RepID=UPI0034C60315